MDRLKKLFRQEQSYEPLLNGETADPGGSEDEQAASAASPPTNTKQQHGFSSIEYCIFLVLGVSMLWAWNMFLAAGPYFQRRFKDDQWILDNFQSAEITVSTITNMGAMLILTRLQANASYPKRINASLIMNTVVFLLLAISTAVQASAKAYFGFLLVMIFLASLAAAFCQNGLFAYVSEFAEPKYIQGIMTGQAVAGVLPCIVQIVSVLSAQRSSRPPEPAALLPEGDDAPSFEPPPIPWTAALGYFLAATIISVATFLAFSYLLARKRRSSLKSRNHPNENSADEQGEHKSIPLLYLFRKLFWLASAVFLTFGVTMIFPVFTQLIVSVRPIAEQSPLFQSPSFIPLALLFWNAGDLLGRLLTAVPSLSLILRPRVVFFLALTRFAFIGLYHLCNIRDRGALVQSDVFYLVVVQLFFGISNGYLGSTCMIGAPHWVEPEERAATGGLMSLCLVGGLTVGSLASFFLTAV